MKQRSVLGSRGRRQFARETATAGGDVSGSSPSAARRPIYSTRYEPICLAVLALGGLLGCGAAEEPRASDAVEDSRGALRDRYRPAAPSNFRVTATTPFSASLAWNPATDPSGALAYVLTATAGTAVTLPPTTTRFTWSDGLAPRNSYTFILYARDAAGNASASTSVSAQLPADTVAPGAPALSVTAIGSTYVGLSWTPAPDDGPFLFYEIWRDGSPYLRAGTNRSLTVSLLQAATSYTFAVRAYDYGPNWSPLSNALRVTTAPINSADTTPPSTPTRLSGQWWDDGEVHLRWDASTDDIDPQSVIRYDVYVNGVLSDTLVGSSARSVVYANAGVRNLFDVVASDTAGNRAAAASLALVLSN